MLDCGFALCSGSTSDGSLAIATQPRSYALGQRASLNINARRLLSEVYQLLSVIRKALCAPHVSAADTNAQLWVGPVFSPAWSSLAVFQNGSTL